MHVPQISARAREVSLSARHLLTSPNRYLSRNHSLYVLWAALACPPRSYLRAGAERGVPIWSLGSWDYNAVAVINNGGHVRPVYVRRTSGVFKV